MFIGPLPVFGYIGLTLLLLTILQVLMGRRTLKVNFKYHRINGYVILTVGIIHATLALSFFLLPLR